MKKQKLMGDFKRNYILFSNKTCQKFYILYYWVQRIYM